MTIIVVLSLISWTILLTLVVTADTEDRKTAAFTLFMVLAIIHIGFQWGAAWQRGYFDAKPTNQTSADHLP